MPRCLRAILTVALLAAGASAAHAQTVAMYGEYHEAGELIVHVPQNPPVIDCVPPPLLVAPPSHLTVGGARSFQHLDPRPTGLNDARCHDREQHVGFNTTAMGVFRKPRIGSRGARNIDNPAGGLAVGDPFTIPPFAFQQALGPQVGVVLNNVVRQIDTTFIAAMPGIDRNGPNPGPLPAGSYTIQTASQLAPVPALTRMFSPMNWQNPGNGWDNGLAVGLVARANANTTHLHTEAGGNEKVRVRYVAGPRQFGGTMALLLDGKGRFYLGPPPSNPTPVALRPVAATFPLALLAGDDVPGLRRRGGIGWNLTIPGFGPAGRVKAFQGHNVTAMGLQPIVAPRCTSADPLNPLPVGCNEVNGFDTYMSGVAPLPPGGTIGQVAGGASVKHLFGLTTGTVSIVRVARRQGAHYSDTVTGMGFDTIGFSTMGGVQRNVGLVAGAYTVRVENGSSGPVTTINTSMLGINLKFTPEPGATAPLAIGVGALGVFGSRRLSGKPGSGRRAGGFPGRLA